MVSFQPIMVMKGATGHDLGLIYELISVLAIVPPLLVAFLSKRLQDRQILLIGLVVKIVGISMFLPLFGPVPAWSVVVGYVLIIKASIFFFTAAMSLFTKLLGRGQLLSGTLMGALSSASALGPALAQLFFADEMMKLFGGWTFGAFMLPVLAATALVCWPWFWARLDPDTEFHTVLRNEYAAAHRRDRGNGAGKGS
jgi:MFS family permease